MKLEEAIVTATNSVWGTAPDGSSRENYIFKHEDGKWRVCIGGKIYDVKYSEPIDAAYALAREIKIRNMTEED